MKSSCIFSRQPAYALDRVEYQGPFSISISTYVQAWRVGIFSGSPGNALLVRYPTIAITILLKSISPSHVRKVSNDSMVAYGE